MSDTLLSHESAIAPGRGLAARVVGVLVAPRATFRDVAANPRPLGVLVVTIIIMAAVMGAFLSTDIGKQALLDQQASVLDALQARGINIPDRAYAEMETRIDRMAITTVLWTVVTVPIMSVVGAGLLLMIFTALLGGAVGFRQVFAVVTHAGVVSALQTLFDTPISYATGDLASPSRLSVFATALDPTSFAVRLLGAVDLFRLWWIVVLAIGLAAVYRRRTGPIVAALLAAYLVIALARAVTGV